MHIYIDWALYKDTFISVICFIGIYLSGRSIEKDQKIIIKEQDEEIAMLKRKLSRWECEIE